MPWVLGGGVAGIVWMTGCWPGSPTAIGADPLDPATRIPAAEAGQAQGRAGLPATEP